MNQLSLITEELIRESIDRPRGGPFVSVVDWKVGLVTRVYHESKNVADEVCRSFRRSGLVNRAYVENVNGVSYESDKK